MSGKAMLALVLTLLAFGRTSAAAAGLFPPIIQSGLQEFERRGANFAFYAWQKGGLMEDASASSGKLQAFKRATDALGAFRSAEPILTKRIGENSKILYTALNCKRGALYMKFWLYRGENDWVVQNFAFSLQPEAIMPWLAVAGESAEETP